MQLLAEQHILLILIHVGAGLAATAHVAIRLANKEAGIVMVILTK